MKTTVDFETVLGGLKITILMQDVTPDDLELIATEITMAANERRASNENDSKPKLVGLPNEPDA